MAYTVTATQVSGATAAGMALTVKVLTGAAGTVGQTASNDAVTVPELAITPINTGSWIYGAVINGVAA